MAAWVIDHVKETGGPGIFSMHPRKQLHCRIVFPAFMCMHEVSKLLSVSVYCKQIHGKHL